MTETSLASLTLMDPDIQECPYPAYDRLREDAPVHVDPVSGMYVVSRYEDIKAVIRDTATFSSEANIERMRDQVYGVPVASRFRAKYEQEGWTRMPSLGGVDDPVHREMRAVFERAFRAGKIRDYEDRIRGFAYGLVDAVASTGACDIVADIATPLPLKVICSIVGAPQNAVPLIQRCTAATVRRLNLNLVVEEEEACIDVEIEAQHYFKALIDRLRDKPDETVLSDIVNARLPGGGQPSDAQLLTHILDDIFLAGAETTAHAIASGVLLMCREDGVMHALVNQRETALKGFIEESLRLESPVQGLYRLVRRDTALHDVTIPAGAIVLMRFGAANRDGRHFGCPERFDLERANAGSHFAFGQGTHHCIGAQLARRELHWAFNALLDRLSDIRLDDACNDYRHRPSVLFRSLEKLHIRFSERADG